MTDDFELTRRKALAALGTIGGASTGAGLGTSAYFSDQETFENNRLTAGELDLKVSWAEHYSDWSEDEAAFARMADGELVVEDRAGFMDATLQEQFPDAETRSAIEAGDADPCEAFADVPDDLEKPVIELGDVKPGDFGEVTFDFLLCDNPGYVWLNGELRDESENGLTEPEADDEDEIEGVVELADEIRVTVWYDDGDNVLEDPETVVTDREFEPNPISSAVAVSGDDRIVAQGTLREVLAQLSTGEGVPLDAVPTGDSPERDCFTDAPTVHSLGFLWELPVDHANEIQSDSVTFDLGFYTEQCRHNDGGGDAAGLSRGLEAYYPLDGTADDASGNGYDGAITGDVSFASGQVGQAASFDGDGDYLDMGDIDVDTTDGLTVSTWAYLASHNSAGETLVGKYDATDDTEWLLWVRGSGDVTFLVVQDDDNYWSGSTEFPTGEWHHVAGVYDRSSVELYFDGTRIGSGAALTGDVDETDVPVRMGYGWLGTGVRDFDGLIDDVRIYARALSASEVQDLYDAA
jgi:predicted ribosomally synthesized peptide with SipW-like signal peptide